ncbi:hypothetical protein [Paenibacillus aceris]|uniref:Helix-turn-helix domain-containing protein n=1 Tax=Paenibacillus aceris TaxID=869555 RepID=A0ABS4HRB6_9BACL|nr:hypothetical protein [Paenibacillus aceris]MBP1961157.1 hypothetical protein [Paenibacillus aceris]NHW35190.1 hypothetical protein [Paenibacillus aceris]
MLRDIERKILRILWNYSHKHRGYMPSFNELSTKTGKYEKEIKFVLSKLAEQNYFIWDGWNTDTINIIRGWEDEPLNIPNQSFIGQG